MNHTVKRCVDELGRIVLPESLRKELKIDTGDVLEIMVEDDSIVLRKIVFEKAIINFDEGGSYDYEKLMKDPIISVAIKKAADYLGITDIEYLELFDQTLREDPESIFGAIDRHRVNKDI